MDYEEHHQAARVAYLDARDAFVEVILGRLRDAVVAGFPEAECLEIDGHQTYDGRLTFRGTGLRSAMGLVTAAGSDRWQTLALSINPLLDELGEVAAAEDFVEMIVLS